MSATAVAPAVTHHAGVLVLPAFETGFASGVYWAEALADFTALDELLATWPERLSAAEGNPYAKGWLSGAVTAAERINNDPVGWPAG